MINQTPKKFLKGKSPFEVLFDVKPSCEHLQIFVYLCFAQVCLKDKFASRSRKCIFVGYPFGKKGSKVFDLETKEIFVTRDVVFSEEVYLYAVQIQGVMSNEKRDSNHNVHEYFEDLDEFCLPAELTDANVTRPENCLGHKPARGLGTNSSATGLERAEMPTDRGSSSDAIVGLNEAEEFMGWTVATMLSCTKK